MGINWLVSFPSLVRWVLERGGSVVPIVTSPKIAWYVDRLQAHNLIATLDHSQCWRGTLGQALYFYGDSYYPEI